MKQYFTGFFTAVCLTASAFLFMGSQTDDTTRVESLVAKEIILEGENGYTMISDGGWMMTDLDLNPLIEIFGDGDEGAAIFCYNSEGIRTVILDATNGGSVETFTNDGKLTTYLGTTDNNNGGKIETFNPSDGINTCFLGTGKNGGGFLKTRNKDDEQTTYCGTGKNGIGFLKTYGNNKVTGFFGTGPKLEGAVGLWNNKGIYTVIIGSLYNDTHNGDGYINLYDRYGEIGWGKSSKN